MHSTLRRLAAFAVMAVMFCGVAAAQSDPPKANVGEPPPQYAAPSSETPVIPAMGPETAAESKMPLLYVTSVEVLRTSTDPRLEDRKSTRLNSSH